MVEAWGTGRKDYSQNIEESVIPIIRSYQVNAYEYGEFDLDPNEQEDIEVSMDFSEDASCHFIAVLEVTVDANVLISLEILSGAVTFGSRFGYQSIAFYFPPKLGLSEITLRIKNYSDIAVIGLYCYNGVQGTEKIMPIPVSE